VTDAIYARTQTIDRYLALDTPDIDLDTLGTVEVGACRVTVLDPVADYADLMERLFDFAAIRAAVAGGLTMAFDAMHAVTGPYATEILEKRLGFAPGTVRNGVPSKTSAGTIPIPTWSMPKSCSTSCSPTPRPISAQPRTAMATAT
jgi:phosphoglucomutase